jgi:hypothetical protein
VASIEPCLESRSWQDGRAGQSRKRIVHSKLERHGEGWQAIRDAVAAPDGWPLYMQRLARQLVA